MDLETLTVEQLEQLAKDAAAAAKKKREEARKELRRKIEAMIRAEGYQLPDVFPELNGVELKPLLVATHRHPEHPELTWTGQGRRPKWLVEAMAAGAELDSFRIR